MKNKPYIKALKAECGLEKESKKFGRKFWREQVKSETKTLKIIGLIGNKFFITG